MLMFLSKTKEYGSLGIFYKNGNMLGLFWNNSYHLVIT